MCLMMRFKLLNNDMLMNGASPMSPHKEQMLVTKKYF